VAIHRIWKEALPYLDTRCNAVHTAISLSLARQLLRAEGGREAVVTPAVILHDVGWKSIPEALQLTAFGPRATAPDLNRRHEVEGVRIAGGILARLGIAGDMLSEILEIIDGHDSRTAALSQNDRLVKDADRLWRYTRTGFAIDLARFGESCDEGLARLERNRERWLFTPTAKTLAAANLARRRKEWRR
jgi:HD superfamily phosphodiesterase